MKKLYTLFAGLLLCGFAHALNLNLISATNSCSSPCNGSIIVQATNGNQPFTYTLNPGNVTNSSGLFLNLCAGTYTITATDLSSNTATLTHTIITIPAGPTVTGVVTSAITPPSNYQAQVSFTGGNAPYYVNWYTMPSQTLIRTDTVTTLNDTISHLSPGDYGVIVFDSANYNAGCGVVTAQPFLFSVCDPTVGGGVISVSPSDTVCAGATITVTYTPIPFFQPHFLASSYFSDNPNCDPSASNGTFTTVINQTTTFLGSWMYGNCPPISYAPITVTVLPCVGIAEQQQVRVGVEVFPNPSSGEISLRSSARGEVDVTIFDEAGRSCAALVLEPGSTKKLSLGAGLYFCRMQSGDQVEMKKVVITSGR